MVTSQPTPIGHRIAEILRQRGMTQAALATVSRLKPYEISRIISGKRKPTLQTLEMIASGLDLTLDKLAGGTSAEEYLARDQQQVSRSDYEQVLARLNESQRENLELQAQLETALVSLAGHERLMAELRAVNVHNQELAEIREKESNLLAELRSETERIRGQLNESRLHVFKLELTVQAQARQLESKSQTNVTMTETLSRTQTEFAALRNAYHDLYTQYCQLWKKYRSTPPPQAADAAGLFVAGLLGVGLGALASSAVKRR